MLLKVRIHSAKIRAILVVAIGAMVGIGAHLVKKQDAGNHQVAVSVLEAIETLEDHVILPTVVLDIPHAAYEQAWSSALAAAIGGVAEYQVASGRVDVLTSAYAIEVDRLNKWHEGIGQALHYGRATGKTPALALIIPSDSWPLSSSAVEKLHVIESTALSGGVKIILLKRRGSPNALPHQ